MIRVGVLGRTSPERAQVRKVLEGDGGIWAVGEGRADQAPQPVRAIRPHVLVDSHHDPEEALNALRSGPSPGPARTVLLGRLSQRATGPLSRHDVRGILLRADAVAHLHWAVRATAAGSVALTPGAARFVVDAFVRPGRATEESAEARQRLGTLGVRETEILELLAEGVSNTVVADRLGISTHTVKDHIRTIYGKLLVRNRIQAARVLWRAQIRRPATPRA
ncbi:LuxR C-terminal-related transcriptional regulator [Streptomyces sp. NPDC005017]|uniref:helix-turn-helix transcriptional regulator n=1 Tax=Streptomyces sp. NPDC005017 TaxID=3364706 RepID=UPI0036B23FDE